MSFIKQLLAIIGHAFAKLWETSEDEFDKLPPEQQQGIIDGSSMTQIIRQNLDAGETAITGLIIQKLQLDPAVIDPLLQGLYKEFNVTTIAEYQAILKSSTGSLLSGILETSAKVLAIARTKGAVTWESLGLGLLQVAFQKYVKPNN